MGLNQRAYGLALGVGSHREVQHIGCARVAAAVRIERVLVEAHHQDAGVARHNVLGPVAVVHIKVDDGHALQPVVLQRVFGCQRHVVDQAKTHRPVVAGVVPRRAHRAKRVFCLALYHRIGGRQRGSGGAAYGVPGARVHGGVRIQVT